MPRCGWWARIRRTGAEVKVAYAGEAGAFGEEAARMLPDAEPLPCPSFAAVFEAVERGEADRGVVPLHNSRAGMVEEVVRLLARSRLQVADRLAVRVRQPSSRCPGYGSRTSGRWRPTRRRWPSAAGSSSNTAGRW
jgi:hypothetical protein